MFVGNDQIEDSKFRRIRYALIIVFLAPTGIDRPLVGCALGRTGFATVLWKPWKADDAVLRSPAIFGPLLSAVTTADRDMAVGSLSLRLTCQGVQQSEDAILLWENKRRFPLG